MLKKMGWEGAGLGAEEQGIQEPVKGGEVRDAVDKYKVRECVGRCLYMYMYIPFMRMYSIVGTLVWKFGKITKLKIHQQYYLCITRWPATIMLPNLKFAIFFCSPNLCLTKLFQ